MGRRYGVALSFANLVYLRAWDSLAVRSPEALYGRKTLPTPQQYAAVAADVLALSIAVYGLLRLEAKVPAWLQRILLAAALLAVAFPLLPIAAAHLPFHAAPRQLAAAAGAAGLGIVGLIFLRFDWAARAARALALAALPCVPVTFAGVGIVMLQRPALAPDPLPAARLAGGPPVRVLWLIFDEWDQRLSFTHRLPATAMPAMDRLASVSFVGTRALAAEAAGRPVARMNTVVSMPSLLYGKRVVDERVVNAGRMDLAFEDGSRARFGEGPNFFSMARARGWNSAVGGWYLPYCRSFGAQVSSCYWDHLYDRSNATGPDFGQAVWQETQLLAENALFAPFGQRLTTLRHADQYRALADFARRTAADPTIGVALVHFNIPHTPYFHRAANGTVGYDATLELLDQTVAGILETLAKSGLDGKTALILSADHPARFPTRIDGGQDTHVPFIVHLPGEQTGMAFDGEFSALATVPLALAIAGGEVATPGAVAKFVMEGNAGAGRVQRTAVGK
jgi:hypothetical protein